MESMIEKVARALWANDMQSRLVNPDSYGFDILRDEAKESYRRKARVAIGAMRKPTQLMLDAVDKAEDAAGYCHAAYETMGAEEAWPVMIDAALKEPAKA